MNSPMILSPSPVILDTAHDLGACMQLKALKTKSQMNNFECIPCVQNSKSTAKFNQAESGIRPHR